MGNKPETEMCPLISKAHMNKVLGYIESGKKAGAKLLCGGNRITERGLENGYFVEPTVFSETNSSVEIVQQEIFGPALTVQKFVDEDDAIKHANNSVFGLAGSVFTQDGAKALRTVKRLRAGITWVNTYHATFNEAPGGGYKQCGIGRCLGIS